MPFVLEASCGNFVGCAKNENEDNFYFDNLIIPIEKNDFNATIDCVEDLSKARAYAIFDGMGGESNARQASFIAAETFSNCYNGCNQYIPNPKQFFLDYCNAADLAIEEMAQEKRLSASGSTFAGLIFSNTEVASCNVGDSKIFRIYDEKIVQLSVEHTDREVLKKIGIKKKPTLLQYLGMKKQGVEIEPFISKGSIKGDNYFVLCSDGVSDVVSPSNIFKYIKEYSTPKRVVEAVLEEVKKMNGMDNSTVIVVKITEQRS